MTRPKQSTCRVRATTMIPLLLLSTILSIAHAELQLVQVLFRHGDRAPSFAYPLDPHSDESNWPRGWSQLTERGISQAEELGSFLRERYFSSGQLSPLFHRKKSYVRSSAKDRCIETAIGVTRQLYPDQIVPIHTYSHHWEDLLLKPNSVKCDRYGELVRNDEQLLHAQLAREYSDFFAHTSNHSGWRMTPKNVNDLYNVVYRESVNGLSQPDWVHQISNPMRNSTVFDEILELKRMVRMEQFNSHEKSLLKAGFLLGQLVGNIQKRVEGSVEREIELYATHDATITALMYNLGISNHQIPPYCSALIVEMHKEREEHYLKILYRNSTLHEPFEVELPICAGHAHCHLADFYQFTRPRSISNREEHDQMCSQKEVVVRGNIFGGFSDWIWRISIIGQLALIVSIYFTLLGQEYKH